MAKCVRIEDGKMTIEEVTSDTLRSVDWLQGQVGGLFEAFLTDGLGAERMIAWCDEEFLLKSPRPKPNVTRWDGTVIHGPVVILGCDAEGESRGLTSEELGRIRITESWPGHAPLLELLPRARR